MKVGYEGAWVHWSRKLTLEYGLVLEHHCMSENQP